MVDYPSHCNISLLHIFSILLKRRTFPFDLLICSVSFFNLVDLLQVSDMAAVKSPPPRNLSVRLQSRTFP